MKIKNHITLYFLWVAFMYNERYFLKHEQHFFDQFEFENGFIMENVKVDYGVFGTPKYDDEGNIINAILFCHNFEGNYSRISDFNSWTEKNKVFDKDEYYFISITSLGFPESCSPSTSGLNHNFPNYQIEDLVKFQRRLIREKFPNIKKLKGIIGYSVGGYIALGWSIYYPDDMDFIILLNSSFKSQGHRYVFANLANRIIEQSSQYSLDLYDESISRLLISISQIHYILSFSKDYLNNLSILDIDLSIEGFAEDILFIDIYDIKFCNDFILSYNLEDDLDKIKCNVCIIAGDSTNYYVAKYDSIPIHEAVEGSTYLPLDIDDDDLNILNHIYKVEPNLKEFIDSI